MKQTFGLFLNFSSNAFKNGIAAMHGAHQVAQNSKTIALFLKS